MENKSVVILTTVLLAFIFYICHISVLAAPQEKPAHSYVESQTHKGKVITTMDSGGYTYIEFEEKGKKLWVACSKTPVHVDDMIEFSREITLKPGSIKKAEGGYTAAECYSMRDSLD
jgi:hypothetical protein